MARKLRVLVLGDEGVALFFTNGTKIERECSLPWAVPNLEAELIEVLHNKKYRHIPVFILYDAIEQQYRKEEIVKTNILDQKKLVKRKLSSLFPNVLAYSYIHLKPNKKIKQKVKSRHNSYLIAALPSTDHMRQIEAILQESRVDIAGLAFLPVESSNFAGAFLERLAKKKKKGDAANLSRWTLMVSHHETGGLRQIFTKDGTLALTRLTPLSDNSPDNPNWVEELYNEFSSTMAYISRFGFSTADGLDMVVICNEHNKQELQKHDFKGANLQAFTVDEAAKLFGFSISSKRKNPHDQYADLLHAGWLARQRKLKMPFAVKWIEKIAVPRKAIKSASGIMALSMLALGFLAFTTWQDYERLQNEINFRESNKRVLEQEYEQESKIFDHLPVRPRTIRTTLEVKEILDDHSIYSYPVLDKIHAALLNKATLLHLQYEDNRPMEDQITQTRPQPRTGVASLRGGREEGITIRVRFRVPDALELDRKIQAVEDIKRSLERQFPGAEVRIDQQYGGGSMAQLADGPVAGLLKDGVEPGQQPAAPQQAQRAPRPEDDYAEISITGARI